MMKAAGTTAGFIDSVMTKNGVYAQSVRTKQTKAPGHPRSGSDEE